MPDRNRRRSAGEGAYAGGFVDFDEWARDSYTVTDDDVDREILLETGGDVVKLTYRHVGDGFLAYFFVSE